MAKLNMYGDEGVKPPSAKAVFARVFDQEADVDVAGFVGDVCIGEATDRIIMKVWR